MTRVTVSTILLGLLLAAAPSLAAPPSDPIYIRLENGWKGLYPLEDDYAEFSLKGSQIQLQDAHHIFLKPAEGQKPSVGMMITFADKKQFSAGNDLLSDHAQWELAYWRQHASKVESSNRDDLGGMRSDLRVTEIRLYNNQGARLNVYLVALATSQGVLVMSISPADGSIDPLVREIVSSLKLVHQRLNPDEVKRLAAEVRKQ
jgi:hypothetical protein